MLMSSKTRILFTSLSYCFKDTGTVYAPVIDHPPDFYVTSQSLPFLSCNEAKHIQYEGVCFLFNKQRGACALQTRSTPMTVLYTVRNAQQIP
jgi:hypothetical protein